MQKLLRDKRGSSLVLVLVTMTFIILLAGAIVTMTITNIWLKASQKRSEENFYHTDSVLDSIAAGIQNESSKASADAYAFALSGYNASLTAADDSIADQYTLDYLSKMIDALSGGQSVYQEGRTDYVFSDDVLKSYLTAGEQTSYIGDSTGANEMEMRGETLVLKNISVYKVEGSYETTLTTDIAIEVPMVSTDAHSEYLEYAILADDQILANAKTAAINGSIYAGTVNRMVGDESSKAGIRSHEGLCITNNGNITVSAEYIITRGDLALADGSSITVDGNGVSNAKLWVENITTDAAPDGQAGGNTITINGECNVSDDMELNGKGDTAKLSGDYFGYNYSNDYTDANNVAVNAAYSSAISLNGEGTSLDLSTLDTLVLSGRTFISKKTSGDEANELDAAGIKNPDIELGTSLSVKSSQLAYYVPSDYIKTTIELGTGNYTMPSTALPAEGAVREAGKPETNWLFFEISGTTYAFDYESYNEYVMPDDASYSSSLQGTSGNSIIANQSHFDIRDYIGAGIQQADGSIAYQYNNSHPLQLYYRHNTAISEQEIKYFYLNFDTTDGSGGQTSKKAGIFYAVFHDKSPQQTGVYDEVDERYLSGNGVLLNDNAQIMQTSGDILYSKAGETRLQVKIQNSDPMADSFLYDYAKVKSKEYMSRQLALVRDYSDAKSSTLWRLLESDEHDLSKSGINVNNTEVTDPERNHKVSNLFDKLVDRSQLPVTEQAEVETIDGQEFAFVTSKSDVTWPLSTHTNVKYGIIITSGNVTVNGDFNGLIISGGDVEVGATNITINSQKKIVEDALTFDKALAAPRVYNMLSRYFRKSVDATIGTSDATQLDNVGFENWTKN